MLMPWLPHGSPKMRTGSPRSNSPLHLLIQPLTYPIRSWGQRLLASIVLTGVMLPLSGISALADDFNPPDRGLPGRRRGGGTRNPQVECVQSTDQVLTVLLPENSLGLTIADYPQIFWFTPPHQAPLVEISLYATNTDFQDEELLFLSQFKTSGEGGISQFKVPPAINFAPLKEGDVYHWYVSLICDPNDRSQDVTVSGWIERVPVPSTLAHTLDSLVGIDRYKALAKEGLWFDALDTWASLHCDSREKSDVLNSLWQNLLGDDQVNLEELSQVQWLNTCNK